jgi:hypothetical protein
LHALIAVGRLSLRFLFLWVGIRIGLNPWIRIRIETSADAQHKFYLSPVCLVLLTSFSSVAKKLDSGSEENGSRRPKFSL